MPHVASRGAGGVKKNGAGSFEFGAPGHWNWSVSLVASFFFQILLRFGWVFESNFPVMELSLFLSESIAR